MNELKLNYNIRFVFSVFFPCTAKPSSVSLFLYDMTSSFDGSVLPENAIKWETGARRPDFKTIEKKAVISGVTIEN